MFDYVEVEKPVSSPKKRRRNFGCSEDKSTHDAEASSKDKSVSDVELSDDDDDWEIGAMHDPSKCCADFERFWCQPYYYHPQVPEISEPPKIEEPSPSGTMYEQLADYLETELSLDGLPPNVADLVETCKVLVRSIADDERILAQADENERRLAQAGEDERKLAQVGSDNSVKEEE